jgi:hypothetical protein
VCAIAEPQQRVSVKTRPPPRLNRMSRYAGGSNFVSRRATPRQQFRLTEFRLRRAAAAGIRAARGMAAGARLEAARPAAGMSRVDPRQDQPPGSTRLRVSIVGVSRQGTDALQCFRSAASGMRRTIAPLPGRPSVFCFGKLSSTIKVSTDTLMVAHPGAGGPGWRHWGGARSRERALCGRAAARYHFRRPSSDP